MAFGAFQQCRSWRGRLHATGARQASIFQYTRVDQVDELRRDDMHYSHDDELNATARFVAMRSCRTADPDGRREQVVTTASSADNFNTTAPYINVRD